MRLYARYMAVILIAAIFITGCGINSRVCRGAANTLEDYNAAFTSIEITIEALYAAGKFSPDKYDKFCELRAAWVVAYTTLSAMADMCDTPETAHTTLVQAATLAALLVEIEAIF